MIRRRAATQSSLMERSRSRVTATTHSPERRLICQTGRDGDRGSDHVETESGPSGPTPYQHGFARDSAGLADAGRILGQTTGQRLTGYKWAIPTHPAEDCGWKCDAQNINCRAPEVYECRALGQSDSRADECLYGHIQGCGHDLYAGQCRRQSICRVEPWSGARAIGPRVYIRGGHGWDERPIEFQLRQPGAGRGLPLCDGTMCDNAIVV